MTSGERLYSTQNVLPEAVMRSSLFPVEALAHFIMAGVRDLFDRAREDGHELDVNTLAITTRRDNLLNGTLLSTRIQSAS